MALIAIKQYDRTLLAHYKWIQGCIVCHKQEDKERGNWV